MFSKMNRVVVVGCGGIGSWLIPPLARLLEAEGAKFPLHIYDGDSYSPSNMARQEFDPAEVNSNKAAVMAKKVSHMTPLLRTYYYGEYVTPENIGSVVTEGTILLTGVDNHPCRVLIERAAQQLQDVAVFTAANEALDGNVHAFIKKGGSELTLPFLTRHPEALLTAEGERRPGCEDTIEDGGTQLLVTNLWAATSLLGMFFVYLKSGTSIEGIPIGGRPNEIYFDVGKLKVG